MKRHEVSVSTRRCVGFVALVIVAFGCAMAAVSHTRFRIYVENDTFDDVRIHTDTGFLLGDVRAGEHTSLVATCHDYMSRRNGFYIERVRGNGISYPLRGELVGTCADSLVIYIPASGIRRATVAVW